MYFDRLHALPASEHAHRQFPKRESHSVEFTRRQSRRLFLSSTLTGAVCGAGALALSACSAATGGNTAKPETSAPPAPSSPPGASLQPLAANADEALKLLTDGNQRFADDRVQHVDDSLDRRLAVRGAQKPFATILSCVDSRVPVELLFDRGIGDLVVIRSAGEVLDRSVIGSLEFGVAELNTPLLMVLGHQRCGALTAAVKAFDSKSPGEDDLGFLATALEPAVRQATGQPGDRVTNAVRANVALTLGQLRQSPLLGPLEQQGKVRMVGGYYDLDTGKVDVI
jgi:carbonic anhydrase